MRIVLFCIRRRFAHGSVFPATLPRTTLSLEFGRDPFDERFRLLLPDSRTPSSARRGRRRGERAPIDRLREASIAIANFPSTSEGGRMNRMKLGFIVALAAAATALPATAQDYPTRPVALMVAFGLWWSR